MIFSLRCGLMQLQMFVNQFIALIMFNLLYIIIIEKMHMVQELIVYDKPKYTINFKGIHFKEQLILIIKNKIPQTNFFTLHMENSKNCFSPILQLCKYDNRNILEETLLTICNNTSFDPIHDHDNSLISQNDRENRPLNAQNQTSQQVRTYPQYQNSSAQRVSMSQKNSSINPQRFGINTGPAMQGVQINGLNNIVLRQEIKEKRIMVTSSNRQPNLSHLNISMPARNNNFRQYSVNNQYPQIIPIIPYQYHIFQPEKQAFAQNIDTHPNGFKEQQNNIHYGIINNKNTFQFVGMARRLSQVPKNQNPMRWNYSNQVKVNSRSYSIPKTMQWKDDPNSTNSTNATAGMYRTERYASQSTNGKMNQFTNHPNKNPSHTLGIINQVEPMNYNGSARNRYYHGPRSGK